MVGKPSAGRLISRLSNQIRRQLDAFSIRNSMSGSQGRILHFILAQPDEVFQKDIEEEFCLRPSSASGILKLMEQNGLIRRISSPRDARLKQIIVTPKASLLKDRVIHDVNELEVSLTRGISDADMEIFFRVIQQMYHNISD